MKLETGVPFIPEKIEIESDVQLADASLRREAGIRLTITWINRRGREWGMVHFISEKDLAG